MKDKSKRWAKGVHKGLVDAVLKLKPSSVKFEIDAPRTVCCEVLTNNGTGFGVSVCSVMDRPKFSYKIGKDIALGRALQALKTKHRAGAIRTVPSSFPRHWSFRQVNNVAQAGYSYKYKSVFVKGVVYDVCKESQV